VTLAAALDLFGARRIEGRPIRIALIDSGVYAEHPHVHGVAGGISLVAGTSPDVFIDRNGHGTAVAAVVREKAPGAEIFAIKIFDRELAATATELTRGIEWALEHRIDLINLSLGTTNPAHAGRLQEAVLKARAADAVVISASDQAGLPSLPGSLQGVVSVSLDWEVARDAAVVDAGSHDVVRLRASGYPRPIPGVPTSRNLKGISFAVANATGLIARVLTMSKS
jgi:subtilisin family serine protease